MSLVNMNEVLLPAMASGYAVPAFNVCNLEFVKMVIKKAEELRSPVIIALHPVEIDYVGLQEISLIISVMAKKANIPVVLHLDHGDTYKRTVQCVRNGFTSIMFDGSHEILDKNIQLTAEIVNMAHAVDVSVEGEIGLVGGNECDQYAHAKELDSSKLTDPEEAKLFVDKTKVDSLAVAIGSAHGIYTGVPRIDLKRLKEIRKKVDIPLVLHGGSGISDEVIKECIKNGISKVNIATELKIAYHKGICNIITEFPNEFEPRTIFKRAMNEGEELIEHKIRLFGSNNRV